MEQERRIELWAALCRAQAGDREAAETVIAAYLPLCRKWAMHYWSQRGCLEFEDLMQEARLGVLASLRRWKGTGFDPAPAVRAAVQDACINQGHMIRIPLGTYKKRIMDRNAGLDVPPLAAERPVDSLDRRVGENGPLLGEVLFASGRRGDVIVAGGLTRLPGGAR